MTEIAAGTLVVTVLILALTFALLFARDRLIPRGATNVTVNDDLTVMARRGDFLLAVLHGAGLAIPAGCGGKGTCGLCRVQAQGEGAGQAGPAERALLSPRERRDHVRLACQVSVRGPIDVTVAEALLKVETMECTVLSNRMLAPLIRELVLALPDGQEMAFRAGDFMQLAAPPYSLDFADIDVPERYATAWKDAGWGNMIMRSPKQVTRAYSIANRPQDRGRAVFNIRLAVPPAGREQDIPPGIVSSYLFSLQPGDAVGMSGPYGEFHARDTDREMVFIGGGVGMAPLRALIHEQVASGARRRMTYFYGARSGIDLFYVEEFEAIAREHATFRWVPALSDPAPGDRWTGPTGFIHERVRDTLRNHPAPEACEYYLCGPPMMISAVIATLLSLGVERESIFNDDFGS